MKQGLSWVPLCLSLSACGGGGAETSTTPPTTPTPPAAIGRAALAASGYAGAGAQVRFGETYELANDQSLSGTPSGSGMSYVMVSRSPMQINFTSATMLTLASQGQQYSLFDGDGDSVFEPISGGHPKVLAVIVEKEAALVMAIEMTSAGQVDTTYSAIGPNTDPTAMPASGSAQYTGPVNAALQPSVIPSAQLSEFSGTGTFNVDFTANTVAGSMVYSQSSDPQFTPGSTILTVTLPARPSPKTPLRPLQAPHNSTRSQNMAQASAPCASRVIFLAKQAAPLPGFLMARAQIAAATPLTCTAGS